MIVAGAAATWVMEPGERDSGGDAPGLTLADFAMVLRERSLMSLLAGVTIPMNVLMAAFLWYLVPLTMADGGSDASTIARTLMIYYLVILLGGPVVGRVAGRRFALWSLVAAGSVVSAAALFVPAIAPSTLTISLAVLVVGIGHVAIRGPQIALALEIADAQLPLGGRDAALAAMRSLERLGSLAGLLVISVIAARFGLETAIGAVAVAGVLAGIGFVATRRPALERADA